MDESSSVAAPSRALKRRALAFAVLLGCVIGALAAFASVPLLYVTAFVIAGGDSMKDPNVMGAALGIGLGAVFLGGVAIPVLAVREATTRAGLVSLIRVGEGTLAVILALFAFLSGRPDPRQAFFEKEGHHRIVSVELSEAPDGTGKLVRVKASGRETYDYQLTLDVSIRARRLTCGFATRTQTRLGPGEIVVEATIRYDQLIKQFDDCRLPRYSNGRLPLLIRLIALAPNDPRHWSFEDWADSRQLSFFLPEPVTAALR